MSHMCVCNNTMSVKCKKTHVDAVIPNYAKYGDAGLDMTAIDMVITADYIEYDTGISVEIPNGFVGLLFPRSSNSKKDLLLCNSVGVIDSSYRGNVKFRYKEIIPVYVVTDPDTNAYDVNVYDIGDRVGQLVIMPYPKIELVEVDELATTDRGDAGFGSTGTQ